jgi:hypothetical protein
MPTCVCTSDRVLVLCAQDVVRTLTPSVGRMTCACAHARTYIHDYFNSSILIRRHAHRDIQACEQSYTYSKVYAHVKNYTYIHTYTHTYTQHSADIAPSLIRRSASFSGSMRPKLSSCGRKVTRSREGLRHGIASYARLRPIHHTCVRVQVAHVSVATPARASMHRRVFYRL